MYHYQLFHLKVSSIFPIIGMEECIFSDAPDVSIRTAKLEPPPKDLPETFYKPASVANQNLYYLEIEDIARFQINGKSEVFLELSLNFHATKGQGNTYSLDRALNRKFEKRSLWNRNIDESKTIHKSKKWEHKWKKRSLF